MIVTQIPAVESIGCVSHAQLLNFNVSIQTLYSDQKTIAVEIYTSEIACFCLIAREVIDGKEWLVFEKIVTTKLLLEIAVHYTIFHGIVG